MSCRHFRTVVLLDCGAPIDKVVAMRDALRALAVAQPRFLPDKVDVHILGLGANGVELLVQAWNSPFEATVGMRLAWHWKNFDEEALMTGERRCTPHTRSNRRKGTVALS